MATFRSIAVMMVFVFVLSMGMACSSKEPASQLTGADKENRPAASFEEKEATAPEPAVQPGMQPGETASGQAPPEAMPKTLALTGTVQQAGDRILLVTDLGEYILSGKDLSEMVGKTVDVTGAVEEAGGEYRINVISVAEKLQ